VPVVIELQKSLTVSFMPITVLGDIQSMTWALVQESGSIILNKTWGAMSKYYWGLSLVGKTSQCVREKIQVHHGMANFWHKVALSWNCDFTMCLHWTFGAVSGRHLLRRLRNIEVCFITVNHHHREWGSSLSTSGCYCRHFPYSLHHFFTCEKLGEINLLQTGLSEWIPHGYTCLWHNQPLSTLLPISKLNIWSQHKSDNSDDKWRQVTTKKWKH
jgi:hypothetical protein